MNAHDTNPRKIYVDGTTASFHKETGKAFFDIFRELSSSSDAPEKVKQDFKMLSDWLGYTDASNMQPDLEKMSIAWTSYLALGLAPSMQLVSAFETYKEDSTREKWPTIGLPPNIREIFDRMLATDNEIAKMRETRQSDWAFDFSKAIPEAAGVAVLVIALMIDSRNTDQGYYDFLRLAVTSVAIYLAVRAYRLKQTAWLWALAGVALLYNPVFSVHLDRDDWWPLNAGAAIAFAIYAYVTQRGQAKN